MNSHILIKEEELNQGDIRMPDMSKANQKMLWGRVIAVPHTSKVTEAIVGKDIAEKLSANLGIEVGDMVMYSPYMKNTVTINNTQYEVVKTTSLFVVYKGEDRDQTI